MKPRWLIAISALLCVLTACRREPNINVKVEFRHLRPDEKILDIRQVDQNNNLGDEVAKTVDALRLKATARGGGGASATPPVHVLLLAQEPVLSSAELAITRSGDVVYLLRNRQWEAYTGEVVKPAEQKIRIAVDPNKKGAFALNVTGIQQEPHAFTYVPSFDEDVQPTQIEQPK